MNTYRFFPLIAIAFLTLFLFNSPAIYSQDDGKDAEQSKTKATSLSGLKFRCLGPAITSGRITDIAIHPSNTSTWYVTVASGGVWKTTNNGTTWKPIFDSQSSYSIGCVSIDPANPHVVWVGSGENNSQRSVSYGDGVYKSSDGGKSWKNVGLKSSEHIAKIVIDPRNSNVVYVAAQGPLWGPGGDRGLYKTTDGGETWNAVLSISENTGVTDLVYDPRNPDVLYAASYQRRRHVWTLINGGPESMLFKSEDAGASWDTLRTGLPSGDVGRIGLAIPPTNPDIVYAIIEAQDDKSGVYRSTDRGASWTKRNGHVATSPQYYQELVCDPLDEDKLYSLNTRTKVSEDGGKTFRNIGNKHRHVDDHALWIDPDDTRHLIIGGDGGLYVSYDAKEWDFIENLPVTQFYRVSVDNEKPFYYVYGGTQDNSSLGAPSRSTKSSGIGNEDWLFTNGGDGFESQIDPTNPDIVYAQAQYGWIVRYDKKSGERIGIQPQPGKGEAPYRWNWDSPLLISPHKHTRLYFCANKVFRSEDRGNSWQTISPDLSKQLDRNALEIMGKVWSVDAISKNASTSPYGNIVSFDESPLKEGQLYVGTDDGLVHVSSNGGTDWNKSEALPGVPELAYVSCLTASQHKEGLVYATFENHKMADFKPYVFKSEDNGESWQSISATLPDNGPVYVIKEDHKDPNLLFVGTEFGVFFSSDGGAKWKQLKSGVPTIAVKDIAIQNDEDDLVLGTFGRGFYILDDYSSLRQLSEENLAKDAHIFDVPDALVYIQRNDQGRKSQGSTYYAAPNPPFGASFTYHVKKGYTSLKQQRRKQEKKLAKKNESAPYPNYEKLYAEDTEEKPTLLFTIRDADKNVVRKLKTVLKKGVQRITWDLRYPGLAPVSSEKQKDRPGLLVMPGEYSVELALYENGSTKTLAGPENFRVVTLNNSTLPAKDKKAVDVFVRKLGRLQRALYGASKLAADTKTRLGVLKNALDMTPSDVTQLKSQLKIISDKIAAMRLKMNGNETLSSRYEPQSPTLIGRFSLAAYQMYSSSSEPTKTHKETYRIVSEEFAVILQDLKTIVEFDLAKLEKDMEAAGAPWTPGRVPIWQAE
jgi:photosystem II stability/assembly factor-like uncharacterized protein